MDGRPAERRAARSSGPIAEATGARTCPSKNTAARQFAVLFGLLLAVQFAAALLTPMGLNESDGIEKQFSLIAVCVWLAGLPLLAVWAVFGPWRAAVRLPMVLWLAAALNLCSLYGLCCNAGGSARGMMLLNAAWLIAFAAFEPPLWLIRVIRRWSLERGAVVADANRGARSAMKPTSQYSLRSLLGWILAAALLLGGYRALPAYIGFEIGRDFQEELAETFLTAIMIALAGLPVVALAWIMLADGRRIMLRIVLSMLILLGLAAACGISGELEGFVPPGKVLMLEAGVLLNGLLGLGVMRTCGYRIQRREKQGAEAVRRHPPQSARISRARFALAFTPLAAVAIVLAWAFPGRIEQWRRADIRAAFTRCGFQVSFADDGTVSHASSGIINATKGKQISDDVCRRLASLESLRELDLSNSKIGDRQLTLLAPLTRLEGLNLAGTRITGRGLAKLKQFPQLRSLNLTNTPITNAGLRRLQDLPKLRSLEMELTEISDSGLAALKTLPALRVLDVQLTAVSSAGAEQFGKSHPQATVKVGASDALITEMPAARHTCTVTDWRSQSIDFETHFTLKRLHARGPTVANGGAIAVTDAGLISLAASQPELEELDLRESAVTDKGLWELRALTELKRLDVRGAPVTEKGVARLASALPDCKILR